ASTYKSDFDKQMMWSLTMSPDGKLLYAANGAVGMIAEIETASSSVRRTNPIVVGSSSAQSSANILPSLVSIAEAKRILLGGSALSPDGKTLFVLGETGLLRIGTAELTVLGSFVPAWLLD